MLDTLLNEETIRAILLAMLLTVGVLTPLLIWRAMLNLEKEERAFNCCKKRIERLKERTGHDKDPYLELMAAAGDDNPMNSSAAVQRYIYGDNAERELNSGYASDRLYAIIASVSTKNLVRKTPSLGDLHELTVQRERGGVSTATFRVLAPGILVMGILGTLLGVHNKLDNITAEVGVSVLADALIPGALAVFFTVLVMVLRGWYNKKLSSFISDFDEYTLTTLLVFFQSETQDSSNVRSLINVLQAVKGGKQTMEDILHGVKKSHEDACESEKLCADLLLQTHENLTEMSIVFGTAFDNHAVLNKLRQDTVKALSSYVRLCHAYAGQLDHIQQWMNRAETLFSYIYEEVGYKGMVYIHGMRGWKMNLQQLRDSAANIGTYVEDQFSMSAIDESVVKLKKLVVFLNSLPDSVQRYKHNESVINAADDFIDNKIAEMAVLAEQLPDLYAEQERRFEKAKLGCKKVFDTYQRMQQEVIEKLRNYNIAIRHMQHGGRSIYASGWRGFVQRVKDRMMKLRSFYKKPWGLVVVLLVWYLLVVWNLWVQL